MGSAMTKVRKPWKRPGNRNRKSSAWQLSLAFASIGTSNLRKFHANRKHYLKCSAKAKSTGERCGQLALANGKCRWHGGLTPAGLEWGRRQMRPKPPSKQRAGDWRKVEAKLRKQARDDQERIRRLQAMSDVQFWAYARRMGRRLEDRFAPSIRRAVREEFLKRGPDPSRTLAGAVAPKKAKANLELLAIEREIEQLRNQLELANLQEGVFG